MPSPRLVVSVSDLEGGPKQVSLELSEDWLRDVLEPAGASPKGSGSVALELTKQGDEVMVRGHANFSAILPCVVTLDPVTFELRPEIFLMLKRGKARKIGGSVPPGGRRERYSSGLRPLAKGASAGEAEGAAKNRKKQGEPEPPAEETALDTFEGDEIVLDDFVREFLLLELPLYPRRPDLPSPEEGIVSRPLAGPTGEPSIDPRLEPLARLAEKLRGVKKE